MSQEFVVFNESGDEIDWIDPVVSLVETDVDYLVDNGYHKYEVDKKAGFSYILRNRKEI